MNRWARVISTIGGARFIGAVGGLYVVLAVVRALFIAAAGGAIGALLVDFVLLAAPGLALLYGAYRLPRTGIHPDVHPRITGWFLGGLGVMLGVVVLLAFNPAGSVDRPLRAGAIATALGSVSGLAIGANEARAITRAYETEQRNKELTRYETLIQEATDVNAILAPDGTFQYLTSSAEHVLGYAPDELVGEEAFEYVHPDDRQKVMRQFADTIEHGQSQLVEFRFEHEDGSWVVLEGSGRNLLDDPVIEGIVAYTHDITERKHLEEELKDTVADLEESNERLEQFAWIASHDLQEPLRMVSSYLQLLEDRYRDDLDSDAQEFIDFAVDGADQMREMVSDLLAYSRLDTHEQTFEPTDCEAVLDRVLADLEEQIDESDAEITADSLPTVVADDTQLEKLFQNLISNAIKYSGDAPPRIELTAEQRDDHWEFAVADNGIGIDSAHTDRIFEVFKRLHTSEDYPGTGIGLPLCQKIVEGHGGRISVESESGEGATFYFTIPTEMEEHD